MELNQVATEMKMPDRFGLSSALLRRMIVLFGIVAYCVTYNWLYIEWLAPTWGYWGFTYHVPPNGLLVLAWFLALFPALWMPIELKRATELPLWMLYAIVYIPCMFGPLYMALVPYTQIAELMLATVAGLLTIRVFQVLPLPSLRIKSIDPTLYWTALTFLLFALDAWVLVSFAGKMKLVSFGDVYSIRDQAKQITSGGLVGYAVLFLAVTLNPLYMALGMQKRKLSIFMMGFGGQILIYAATGLKSVLLSGAAVVFGYYCAKRFKKSYPIAFAVGIPVLFIGLILKVVLHHGPWAFFDQGVLFLGMGRIFAMPGMLMGDYQAFFASHPLTYMTHAKPFNLFADSPYKYALGYEVGAFFNGAVTIDSNSHLWAVDGLGSFGIPGVLLISVIAGFVFWLIDAATKHLDLVFTCAWLGYLGFQLTNLPLLTLLGSGGVGIAILMFGIMPPADARDRKFFRILPLQSATKSIL